MARLLGLLIGTTSAHAENTAAEGTKKRKKRNYLRARGEYTAGVKITSFNQELPPRTRRIPDQRLERSVDRGTTSAHAENTWQDCAGCSEAGNYLRARGEYRKHQPYGAAQPELPPRTRRIPRCLAVRLLRVGTTSAHAENTVTIAVTVVIIVNYLRARGEYVQAEYAIDTCSELPPRTRRIRLGDD